MYVKLKNKKTDSSLLQKSSNRIPRYMTLRYCEYLFITGAWRLIINHFVESSLIEWTFIMVAVSIRYDKVYLYYYFTPENVSVLL